jgi:hypothetical protein
MRAQASIGRHGSAAHKYPKLIEQSVGAVLSNSFASFVRERMYLRFRLRKQRNDAIEDVIHHVLEELSGKPMHPVPGIAHQRLTIGPGQIVADERLYMDRLTNKPVCEHLLELHRRWIEVRPVIDGHLSSACNYHIDQLPCLRCSQCQRLLQKHMCPRCNALTGQWKMHSWWGGDMHYVQTLPGQHLAHIAVPCRYAEPHGELFSQQGFPVADRRQLCALQVLDHLGMSIRDLPAADDPNP